MDTLDVEVVGFAGPGRFDGPPSHDPKYNLKEAQPSTKSTSKISEKRLASALPKRKGTPEYLPS